MFPLHDPQVALHLARDRQSAVRASFRRKARRRPDVPLAAPRGAVSATAIPHVPAPRAETVEVSGAETAHEPVPPRAA